jgi:hypothetical protein
MVHVVVMEYSGETQLALPSPDYCAPGQAWAGRMRCNKL